MDDVNYYQYSENFRAIIGIIYRHDAQVVNSITSVLEAAEHAYQKMILDMAYKSPMGSEQYYIDIYFGNKSAVNGESGQYARIGSRYSGFAEQYTNNTPYIVLNPAGSQSLLKLTVAHELFHTVQFAYKSLSEYMDADIDLWFLEASAVYMEKVIYPELTDYMRFVRSWYPTAYKAIDTFNGSHEYGQCLLVFFLADQFGHLFIRDVIAAFEHQNNAINTMNQLLAKQGTSFNAAFGGFIHAVMHPGQYFDNGDQFPVISYEEISAFNKLTFYKYGPRFFRSAAFYTPFYTTGDSLDAAFSLSNETWLQFIGDYDPFFQYQLETLSPFGNFGWAADQTATVHFDMLHPPRLSIAFSYPALIHQPIGFDASGSYDADGQIHDFFWRFDDGEIQEGQIAERTYAEQGRYVVTLEAKDDDGIHSEKQFSFFVDDPALISNGDIAPLGAPDGQIDMMDAETALKAALGVIDITPELLAYGDVAPLACVSGGKCFPNPDGKFTIGDAALIFRAGRNVVTWEGMATIEHERP